MSKHRKSLLPIFFAVLTILILNVVQVSAAYYGEFGESINDCSVHSGNPTATGNTGSMTTGYNTGYRRFFVEWNTTDAELGDYVYMVFTGQFEQTDAYADYVDFYLYEIDEEWFESNTTWNEQPGLRDRFDEINVTVHADMSEFELYLDITDSWNDFVGASFADYYGYCVIFNKISDYSYYICDTRSGVDVPYLYFSQYELDSDGNPVGTTDPSGTDYSEEIANFMLLFLVLGMPAIAFAGVTNTVSGFIMGLWLGGAIGNIVGLVGMWYFLVLAVVSYVMLFKRGGKDR